MPGVFARYYRPSEPSARDIDALGDTERQARKKLLDRYWKYYDGDQHRPLTVEAGEFDDNVILNLCGQAMDKAVAFFAPQPPKLLLPGETPKQGDESTPQQALDTFWETNELPSFIVDLALAGFIGGHPFVKLLPPETGSKVPSLALLDTRHVTAFWDVTNIKRVLWYRLQWEVVKGDERRQDILPAWLLSDQPRYDPLSAWQIIEYERTQRSGGEWKQIGDDAWDFPFAPVVHWKNLPQPHSFYGQSNLRHVDLNDAVNFVASNTARIIKHHAHPKSVMTGAVLDDLKSTSVDGLYTLPGGATVTNLEMQSDLQSSMRMLDMLRSAFFTQARVVDWASQKDKVGQLTNFGLRVLFNDMLDMIDGAHRVYGKQGLAEISRRGLVMMGHADAPLPECQWTDSLPKDRKESVEAVKVEKELGFTSDRTLAQELGRDYDAEKDRMVDEGGNAGDQFADLMFRINQRGALT